jgi:AbiV family abortive infection protein
VEVCVENAERLLIDATKTSTPTAVALAELSIEEAAKGWMLYFRFMAQGRTVRNLPRISPRMRRAMEESAEATLRDFGSLDERIWEAFHSHRVKLRFLQFLLSQIKVSLPLLNQSDAVLRLRQDLSGPAFNIQEIDSAKEIEQIEHLISSFKLEGISDLDAMKKRGFYVNISEKGDLVSPSIHALPARLLLELAAFLIVSLKGNLILVSRDLSKRPTDQLEKGFGAATHDSRNVPSRVASKKPEGAR